MAINWISVKSIEVPLLGGLAAYIDGLQRQYIDLDELTEKVGVAIVPEELGIKVLFFKPTNGKFAGKKRRGIDINDYGIVVTEASKFGDELAEEVVIDAACEAVEEILKKDGMEGLIRSIKDITKK